jgi:predicted dehydrogenase
MKDRIGLGIIGCGQISAEYLRVCQSFDHLRPIACADRDLPRAATTANAFGLARASSVDELLSRPDVDLIVNLTVPQAHTDLNLAALHAGKHVYSEKPLALSRADAAAVLAEARRRGLEVGCAPDTFLGPGMQTCRRLIDEGAIGRPLSAVALLGSPGVENWHPRPDFYYQAGGGPMMDMGPYYLTALVNLLGPMKRLSGAVHTAYPERLITRGPDSGRAIPVEVATHVSGTIEFHGGAVVTMMVSFDIVAHSLPRLEIYGTEGTLRASEPGGFAGEVALRRRGDTEWRAQALAPSRPNPAGRGIGVADMAQALLAGGPFRATGQLGAHLLDAMLAFTESAESGRHITLQTTCDRPPPLPLDASER